MVSVYWDRTPDASERPAKELVELHKAAEQAMKGLIVRLWPGDALLNSYFGLVRRLVDACPRLEVVKRSV